MKELLHQYYIIPNRDLQFMRASISPCFDALDRMVETGKGGSYTQVVYGPGGGRLALMSGQTLATAFVPLSGGAQAVDSVSLQIDNWNVTPMWAGLSGAGLVQINVTIPGGLSTGDVPLLATVGGAQTPSVVVISLQ